MPDRVQEITIKDPPGIEAVPKPILAKLQRAKEGIFDLNNKINEFTTSDPRPYHVIGGLNHDCTEYLFKGFRKNPPLSFAVRAGEVVHQLRSCFDHLIVELAGRNGQRPLPSHQFPVCMTPEKFEKARNGGNVNGLTQSALDKVIAKQPYNHSGPDYTLLLIHRFDVIDKHRLLLVVDSSAQLGQSLTVKGIDNRPIEGGISIIDPGRVLVKENGENLLTVHFQKPNPHAYAQADFSHQIAFAEAGSHRAASVVIVLAQMIAFTQRVLGEFAEDLA